MNEENISSGAKPEEKKLLRPTVISSGGANVPAKINVAPKATVIKSGTVPETVSRLPLKATAISAGSLPAPAIPKKDALTQPTAIKVLPQQPFPPSPIAPTAIGGKPRKQIAATLADLMRLDSVSELELLEKALVFIKSVDPDSIDEGVISFWGQDHQKKYAEVMAEGLKLQQADVIEKISGYVARMAALLDSLNLKRTAGMEGGVFGLFRRKDPEEIDVVQKEMSQLVKLAGDNFNNLLRLKEGFGSLAQKAKQVCQEISVDCLVSQFFTDFFAKEGAGELSRQSNERAKSLGQSLEQARADDSIRALRVEQIANLVSTVQHVVLMLVPTWLNSIASFKVSLEARRTLTETEVNELGDQSQRIAKLLKGDASCR